MTQRSAGRSLAILLAAVPLVYASASCGGGGGGTGPTSNPADRVDSIALSSDSLNLDSIDVVVGDTLRLAAVPRDSGGNPIAGVQLAWESSNPSAATVSGDGLVTGVGLGNADITVSVVGASSGVARGGAVLANRARGRPSKATTHVVPFLKITPGDRGADIGETISYTATPVDAAGHTIGGRALTAWSSSAPNVATIDASSGTAKARKKGVTSITATMTIGDALSVNASRTLTVGVCSKVLAVKSWNATVSSGWSVGYSNADGSWSIDQGSNGTAVLQSNNNPNFPGWEGGVTGTSHVASTATTPFNKMSNTGSGAQPPGAAIQVDVITTDSTCSYTVLYKDMVTSTFTSLGNPQNFSGVLSEAYDGQPFPNANGQEGFTLSNSVSPYPFQDIGTGPLPFPPWYELHETIANNMPPAALLTRKAQFTYKLVSQ